jgi:hypothetical protein
MQHLLSSLYFTVVFLYMFREHFAPIIRSSKNCMYVQSLVQVVECGSMCRDTVVVSRWYLARWLYMQFLELLMMGAKCSRNM